MFIYNLTIRFYWFIILFASLFNQKAKRFVTGRKYIWQELSKIKEENLYWFHCASLGEFDQGLPLMFLLKEKDPSIKILATFLVHQEWTIIIKENIVLIMFTIYL